LACQDEFLVNNTFDVKENYDHALDFVLRLPRSFRSRRVCAFRVRLMLSFPNACLTTARVSIALFQDLHKLWCCPFVGSIAKSHQAK
jgi:hypothetical protein